MYYNYHAKAKQLIANGHLVKMEIVDKWNAISPALVLYFDNHKPMPIRQYRWDEYFKEGSIGATALNNINELPPVMS